MSDSDRVKQILVECEIPSGIGPGWHPLVIAGYDILNSLLGEDNWKPVQIKEKFGSLRYYIAISSNVPEDRRKLADGLIDDLESASGLIDEESGRPGKVVSHKGWLRTQPLDP